MRHSTVILYMPLFCEDSVADLAKLWNKMLKRSCREILIWSKQHKLFHDVRTSCPWSGVIFPVCCWIMPRPLCTNGSLRNQSLQKCTTHTRNHLFSELKKRWLRTSQSAFKTQQGLASAIFSLEKKWWFLVRGGIVLQASVWRHQIHIPTLYY